MDKKRNYRILFVGNSYTYFNEMPEQYFRVIAQEAGYSVDIDTVLRGGWTLEKHADDKDEFGAQVAAHLSGEGYDYVVLQEQSLRPSVDREKFFSAVLALNEKIRANGAVPVLYSTWGRKEGSVQLEEYDMTNESMTFKTARSYRDIGVQIDALVAFVGLAFYDVGDEIELYNEDKSHPSSEGSYLAALTLFLRIFGDSETLADCGYTPETAARLAAAARRAVFNTPDID